MQSQGRPAAARRALLLGIVAPLRERLIAKTFNDDFSR